MGRGYLRVQVTANDGVLPIADAEVTIRQEESGRFYKTKTDSIGNAGDFPFEAPPKAYTLNPYFRRRAYSTCDVKIKAEGYYEKHIKGAAVVDTQTVILPVTMFPLPNGPEENDEITVEIPVMGLLLSEPYRKTDSPPRAREKVIIPDYITVHLGKPDESWARNVRVPFPDYVKNVASSEIYATWPDESLRANIHAITTFALNRIYTEWYRGNGYNFDMISYRISLIKN